MKALGDVSTLEGDSEEGLPRTMMGSLPELRILKVQVPFWDRKPDPGGRGAARVFTEKEEREEEEEDEEITGVKGGVC